MYFPDRSPALKQNLSNLLLYSLYFAEACNEFMGPISVSLRLRATPLLSKKCCSGGGPLTTLFDLTGLRFEHQTSRSKNEHLTADPTGRSRVSS